MTGKILVFDSINGDSTQLRFLLASAHYEILHLNEPEDVVNYSLSRRPDLILVSGDAEDPVVTEICQTIVSYAVVSDIPVVLVTGACGPSTRIEALRMGVSEVFRAPVDRLVLLARLRSLLRASDDRRQLTPDRRYTGDHELMDDCKPFTGPARIGLVAADAEAAWHLQQRLTPLMNDQFILFPEDSALGDSAMRNMADVFVIAADLTAPSDPLRLYSELRSRSATRHAAFCLIADSSCSDRWATALDLGVDDLIEASADVGELAVRIQKQIAAKRRSDSLRLAMANRVRQAMFDPLTGLFNRRYALPALARIAELAATRHEPFAILLADIDQFKRVNDTFGHTAGDTVLVSVANRLRSCLRPADLLARIGGEEFLIALPGVSLEQAHATAERLRLAICGRQISLSSGEQIEVTASIGLSAGTPAHDSLPDFDQLIFAPDSALLVAKAKGRNRVTIARYAA